ncbi:MAG TPA: DUF1631 family protein, partial [Hydrogenophaga sp.]
LRLRRKRAVIEGHASEDALDLEAIKPVKRVTTLGAKPAAAEQPWMGVREWASAGFEEARPVVPSKTESPTDAESQPGSQEMRPARGLDAAGLADTAIAEAGATELGEDAVLRVLAGLVVGSHVDLLSRGKWVRAELVWCSARATLFMFTSAGGNAHSMTRRICEKLIRSRDLRLVAARPVVETAIREVALGQPARDSASLNLDEALA